MFLDFEGITYHLNLYEVGLSYGGPEEGGWWYDFGLFAECLGTYPTPQAAEEARDELADHLDELREGRFEPSDSRSWNNWPVLYIETHPGERFPKERPRYQ